MPDPDSKDLKSIDKLAPLRVNYIGEPGQRNTRNSNGLQRSQTQETSLPTADKSLDDLINEVDGMLDITNAESATYNAALSRSTDTTLA